MITFDQSDEETWPDNQKDYDSHDLYDNYNDNEATRQAVIDVLANCDWICLDFWLRTSNHSDTRNHLQFLRCF